MNYSYFVDLLKLPPNEKYLLSMTSPSLKLGFISEKTYLLYKQHTFNVVAIISTRILHVMFDYGF